MMQGVRVNSIEPVPVKIPMRKKGLTDLNRQIADSIPYWPETVNQLVLAKRFGLTVKNIQYRIDVFQEEYLIFEEGSEFSRLKRDYSNMEVV